MEKVNHSRYINPLSDFGFKRLFFNELNKELLIDFLNAVLPEESLIVDVQYRPTDRPGMLENDRKAIFDIYCTTDKNEFVVVEMQKAKQAFFGDRSLFYASFPIQEQAPKGPWDFNLKAVYFIGILDFILFEEREDDAEHMIETVRLIRERTGEVFSKKLTFVYIELPKFKKTEAELSTNIDRWLFCLRNLGILDHRPAAVQGRIFEMLYRIAEINLLTEEEMKAYEKSIMEYNDVRNAVDFAREEGVEYGLRKGRSEGLEEGHTKGKLEGKLEVAFNCLKKGMSIADIIQLTGLSEPDILALKNEE